MQIRWLALSAPILVAGGCVTTPTTRIHSYWGATTNRPSQGATFAWSLAANPQSESGESHALLPMIREQIEAGLVHSGYRKYEGKTGADFYVSSFFTQRIQPSDYGPIDSGSLVIDVVSGVDGQRIWRGWAEGPVNPSLAPDARRKRIDNAVTQLLNQFKPA